MFVHAPFPNIIFALDLNNDGKILWKYEPKQDPNVIPVMCCDTVNRGLSYADFIRRTRRLSPWTQRLARSSGR
jgi:glucose dehydrogenase